MVNKTCFFGLLHIKKNENALLNFKSTNDNHKILVYLKNAILLDQQLKNYGYNFILLTNNSRYLKKLLRNLKYNLELKQLHFRTFVPHNTHFYACHFRVDVFKYLSSLKKNYSILLDLDVLILKNPNKIFKYIKNNINLVNDITDNVIPAYGVEKIKKNLKILNINSKNIKWYGGDWFSGNSLFFKTLYKKTNFFQKKFVKNKKLLSDQTDELFMSAAINEIKQQNLHKLKNIRSTGIFTRYWNTNVKHFQKKIPYYQSFHILHVPADKIFLSDCFQNLDRKKNFKDDYFNHIKSLKNLVKKNILHMIPNKLKIIIKKYLIL